MTTLLAERLTTAATKANKPLYKIEFKKDARRSEIGGTYLINPGGFDVYVNGKHWGRTCPESRGPHGSIHFICQMREGGRCPRAFIDRPFPNSNPKYTRTEYFTVQSDKMHILNLKPGEAPRPLKARLESAVLAAIAAGALRDPDLIAAEVARNAEEARRKAAERIQREAAAWREQAGIALAPIRQRLSTTEETYVIARIIEAMKWAQSRSNPDS